MITGMKNLLLGLAVALVTLSASSQGIDGTWRGKLKVQGTELSLVFRISRTTEGYSATMDSPDQGVKGIFVSSVSFADTKLELEVSSLGIEYRAILKEPDRLVGTFKQSGFELPLVLTRSTVKEDGGSGNIRPQEPRKPYPYYSEYVRFTNEKDNVTLSGTLTMPKKEGSFRAVILISGSGPQNRDEELYGHKPFLVLADYLTRKGIAVLRFDDRGVGESTGNFSGATTYDFANDVEAAIAYLLTRKEVNRQQIGLVGHSEGAIIASITASENPNVGFVVLMAGPTLRGDSLLLLQRKKLSEQRGVDSRTIEQSNRIFRRAYDIILNERIDREKLADTLSAYLVTAFGSALPGKHLRAMVNQLTSPWMVGFIRLDPAVYLEKLSCPVLVLNGSLDLNVPSKENLSTIRRIAAQTPRATFEVVEYERLNHFFQECKTGAISEISAIRQTISPKVLRKIADWILLLYR